MLDIFRYNSWLRMIMLLLYFQKHEKECEFIPIDCTNKEYGCTEKVSQSKLSPHLAECKYRLIPCQHCRQNVPAIAMEVGIFYHHQSRWLKGVEYLKSVPWQFHTKGIRNDFTSRIEGRKIQFIYRK